MKASKKIQKKLTERQERWDKLPGTGSGPNTKVVPPASTAYHKPGSQNLRKHN